MKRFFTVRRAFPIEVSRPNPGCFFIIMTVMLVASCQPEKEKLTEALIAKTVPPVYVKAGDSNFVLHQDTVYYAGKYFTGFQFSIYPGGDTAYIKSFFNGVEEGLQKKWYPHHQPEEERFYINGKKEGIHRGWWPDGKPKFYFEALHDEYNGEFKEWYTSGMLGKQFHYINGQEAGSQRLWWENGTVRANYVIRNGKKYGLIGLTTCINPYDSVINK